MTGASQPAIEARRKDKEGLLLSRDTSQSPEWRSIWPYECHTIYITPLGPSGFGQKCGEQDRSPEARHVRWGTINKERTFSLATSSTSIYNQNTDNHPHHLNSIEEKSKKCFIAVIKLHPGSNSSTWESSSSLSVSKYDLHLLGPENGLDFKWIDSISHTLIKSVHEPKIPCGHPLRCTSKFLFFLPLYRSSTTYTNSATSLLGYRVRVIFYGLWSSFTSDRPPEVPL